MFARKASLCRLVAALSALVLIALLPVVAGAQSTVLSRLGVSAVSFVENAYQFYPDGAFELCIPTGKPSANSFICTRLATMTTTV